LSEQLPAIRTELATKETRLREVEKQRAALNNHCGLLTQENDALRTRIEELVVDASKLSRLLSELRDERDEIKGLLRELETSLDHETAAHAKLKAAHFDAIEVQRLSEANLQEKLSATTTRLEAAEQLLAEVRAGMHEQDATIQESEQRVLEKSLEAKSLEARVADLEKDLASALIWRPKSRALPASSSRRRWPNLCMRKRLPFSVQNRRSRRSKLSLMSTRRQPSATALFSKKRSPN